MIQQKTKKRFITICPEHGFEFEDFLMLKELVKMDMSQILKMMSDKFEISEEEIMGKSQKRNITEIRHIFRYLAHISGFTLVEIAKFSKGDHTAVFASKEFIQQMIEINDEKITSMLDEIKCIFAKNIVT